MLKKAGSFGLFIGLMALLVLCPHHTVYADDTAVKNAYVTGLPSGEINTVNPSDTLNSYSTQNDTAANAGLLKGTGKTQAAALAWVKSKVGQSIDYDGAYGAQCVDLILAYYNFLGVPVSSGNAVNYETNTLPSGFTRIAGAAPQPGDVLVYGASSSNQYGHVAIYESDYSTYHQNFNGHSYVENVTAYRYNGFSNPYWGVIRPDFVTINNPTGCVDSYTGGAGCVGVAGWVFDADNTSTSLQVHVYIGGSSANGEGHRIMADGSRTDVDAVYHCGSNHGFGSTIATSLRGMQAVYVYGINIGSGENVELGHSTVNITNPDVANCSAALSNKQYVYDGTAKQPSVSVKFGDITLTNGTDYTVSYKNNISIGTGIVVITGIGKYSGTKTMSFTITAPAKPTNVILSGGSRYETAAQIAKTAFPNGANQAILVTGEKFPDALAANAYAGAKKCPILLSVYGRLSDATRQLLTDTWNGKVKKVFIFGGSFSDTVKSDLAACGVTDISVVAGSERYETAEDICELGLNDGSFNTNACIVTTGLKPADALSIAPWSYMYHMPVLLAKKGSLSAGTLNLVNRFSKVYVLGDKNAVSNETYDRITGTKVRIAGINRYDTSVEIAKTFCGGDASKYNNTGFASGLDVHFPDALAGGMVQGQLGAPILLADSGSTSDVVYDFVYSNYVHKVSKLYFYGAAKGETCEHISSLFD